MSAGRGRGVRCPAAPAHQPRHHPHGVRAPVRQSREHRRRRWHRSKDVVGNLPCSARPAGNSAPAEPSLDSSAAFLARSREAVAVGVSPGFDVTRYFRCPREQHSADRQPGHVDLVRCDSLEPGHRLFCFSPAACTNSASVSVATCSLSAEAVAQTIACLDFFVRLRQGDDSGVNHFRRGGPALPA
jgi:hypothetical protein